MAARASVQSLTPYEFIENNWLQADVHVAKPCEQLIELGLTVIDHHVLEKLQHLQQQQQPAAAKGRR